MWPGSHCSEWIVYQLDLPRNACEAPRVIVKVSNVNNVSLALTPHEYEVGTGRLSLFVKLFIYSMMCYARELLRLGWRMQNLAPTLTHWIPTWLKCQVWVCQVCQPHLPFPSRQHRTRYAVKSLLPGSSLSRSKLKASPLFQRHRDLTTHLRTISCQDDMM